MSDIYCIYTLSDPLNKRVRYVGLSKNLKLRYQQHTTPCTAANWVQDLSKQGKKPILDIIENDIPDKKTAESCERKWIYFYEGRGYDLENHSKNEAAIRERAEKKFCIERLHKTYASHLPLDTAERLIGIILKGHETVGIVAWESRYEVVLKTMHALKKKHRFPLADFIEIEAARITFEQFGDTWTEEEK